MFRVKVQLGTGASREGAGRGLLQVKAWVLFQVLRLVTVPGGNGCPGGGLGVDAVAGIIGITNMKLGSIRSRINPTEAGFFRNPSRFYHADSIFIGNSPMIFRESPQTNKEEPMASSLTTIESLSGTSVFSDQRTLEDIEEEPTWTLTPPGPNPSSRGQGPKLEIESKVVYKSLPARTLDLDWSKKSMSGYKRYRRYRKRETPLPSRGTGHRQVWLPFSKWSKFYRCHRPGETSPAGTRADYVERSDRSLAPVS